jgi:predicted enzyme related to lactoylglutathione lyase
MTNSPRAGAVLYVKHLEHVVAFYVGVFGLTARQVATDHVVLESPTFQLVVVRIHKDVAASIVIGTPPSRRERAPTKLVFFIESIANARTAASKLGGGLNAVGRESQFDGSKVCDGYDPEGNIFQVREPAA